MFRAFMFVAGAMVLGTGGTESPDSAVYTDEEITAKYRALTPSDADFEFSPPVPWSSNLAVRAALIQVRPASAESEANRIVDGQPASTWTARDAQATASFVLDLGESRRFDRLVVFNRQTDQRGIGGGNNAVKRIALSVAVNAPSGDFQAVGEYMLEGPAAICFKRKAGGQACAFIDRTEPNVVELPSTRARYVKVELREAFWGAGADPSWKTSIAVSEIMLFDSRGGKRAPARPPAR